jgi:hypothetical protein
MNTTIKSSKLRIQIKKEQDISVDLDFPIFTLSIMDSFLPEMAHAYLRQSAIDLSAILKRIEDSNYQPQSVLDFQHEGKDFSIWIE